MMKITIDTKEDSQDDIRKVIQILLHAAGNQPGILSNGSSTLPDTTNVMSMFSDTPSSASPALPERDQGTAPDFSSFLSLTAQRKTENKDDIPKVEYF